MHAIVECLNCGACFQIPQSFVGEHAKCKKCGHISVMQPVTDDEPDDEQPEVADTPAGFSDGVTHRAGRSSAFGLDPLTPIILFGAFAALLLVSAFLTGHIHARVNDSDFAGTLTRQLWMWTGMALALLAALIAPLLLCGVYGTARIFNFPLVSGCYVRSCTAAAIPTLLFVFASFFSGLLWWLVMLIAIGAMFYFVLRMFDLQLAAGSVAFALGATGWAIGILIGWLLLSAVPSEIPDGPAAVFHTDWNALLASRKRNVKSDAGPLAHLRDLIKQKTSVDLTEATREDLAPNVAAINHEMDLLRPTYQNDAQWPPIAHQVEEFKAKVDALPSSQLDAALFVKIAEEDDWTTGSLSRGKMAPEVAARQFRFQPPLEMKLDASSAADSPNGLIWTSPTTPDAKMSVAVVKRASKDQHVPLVTDKPALLRVARERGLLAIKATNPTHTFGQINGLDTTRITIDPENAQPITHYTIEQGDVWLVITLWLPQENKPLAKLMDASARTARLLAQ